MENEKLKRENLSKVPTFMYGTAWKEERTADLVKQAVSAGFRAIDTANQKKHYWEDSVGTALIELRNQGIRREDLFLQTKYTYVQGQDHRVPYNPQDDFTTQVKSSFASSLQNLHTDYLDSFLLHGPISGTGIHEEDWEVWHAIESLYQSGQAKRIGVSNVDFDQLKELTEKAKIKPMIVQNRCFAVQEWDKEVRDYCLAHDMVYQGFSLLTANRQVLVDPRLGAIARRLNITPQQVVFRFARQIGILPITGTTNEQHMRGDLQIDQFELTPSEVKLIEEIDI